MKMNTSCRPKFRWMASQRFYEVGTTVILLGLRDTRTDWRLHFEADDVIVRCNNGKQDGTSNFQDPTRNRPPGCYVSTDWVCQFATAIYIRCPPPSIFPRDPLEGLGGAVQFTLTNCIRDLFLFHI